MSSMEKSSSMSILFISTILLSIIVDARELRPSDHGLASQDTSSGADLKGVPGSTQEIENFFNGKSPNRTEDKPTLLPLPLAAKNVTEWWKEKPSSSREKSGEKGGHVRVVLLLASFICGVIGVALMLASGIVFFMRYGKERKNKKQDQQQQQQEQQQRQQE